MVKATYKSISQKEYWNIHQFIRRKYGAANKCENGCLSKYRYEWALIHGRRYNKNIGNYKMLCKKCHHSYDKISRFGKDHPMFGKTHTKENKKKISERMKGNKNMLGKKLSLETRLKMSKARKGIPKSEEHKRKISEAHKIKCLQTNN